MVWLDWHQKSMQLLNLASLREPFHILTIILLGLLLPLSFLLLSRFSSAHYILSLDSTPSSHLSSFLLSFFLYTNPSLLYLIVSIVSIATFVYGFTGKVAFQSESSGPLLLPRLYTAWIFVCTLEVCVGLGIEGSIAAGTDGSINNIGMERNLRSKVIFFLGLHETMLHWSRVVVRPVMDDAFFGVAKEERWFGRVAMAWSFGALWWWKLRDEVESLVVEVDQFKGELLMGRAVADFVSRCLYYMTLTIGIIKVVKGFMWIGLFLLCRRVTGNSPDSNGDDDKV
ncbi:uncharacterized protein LOC122316327 [Carya illinoinensis]|uniref:Transmembrane protein n=1 Tax=Carya illinoinensis TaxID=32201 RepID=A0A8T1Q0L0_CARIL|nr:uncharacterized protein LOC122316327 [Carya illinoinensis]KAG6648008.1 hypothetical protein CIPAW_07G118100 [Carya illinoinensis]